MTEERESPDVEESLNLELMRPLLSQPWFGAAVEEVDNGIVHSVFTS